MIKATVFAVLVIVACTRALPQYPIGSVGSSYPVGGAYPVGGGIGSVGTAYPIGGGGIGSVGTTYPVGGGIGGIGSSYPSGGIRRTETVETSYPGTGYGRVY